MSVLSQQGRQGVHLAEARLTRLDGKALSEVGMVIIEVGVVIIEVGVVVIEVGVVIIEVGVVIIEVGVVVIEVGVVMLPLRGSTRFGLYCNAVECNAARGN